MEIIIYTQTENTQKNLLLKQISKIGQPVSVIIFEIEDLFQQLKLKVSGETILVFLISSEEELDALLENKTRLFNIRFIILLSEDHKDWVSKALAMQPRYLGYTANDYTDVGNVLNKMIKKSVINI
ncbi:hypothetical protein [Desulfobacter sp.]